jgi:hypothetical protein
MLTTTSDSGALLNTFSIGPAVLNASYTWPLLWGHERPISFTLRAALAAGALATLVVTVLALIALAERAGFSRGIARVAAFLAIAFGPLALYGTRIPLNSHLPSALASTLFDPEGGGAAPTEAEALGLQVGRGSATGEGHGVQDGAVVGEREDDRRLVARRLQGIQGRQDEGRVSV